MHCPRCGSKWKDDEFVCIKCGYLEEIAIIAKIKETKSELAEVHFDQSNAYAGFWKRVLALILDVLIISIVVILIMYIMVVIIFGMSVIGRVPVHYKVIRAFTDGFGMILLLAFSWAYFTWFESSIHQATLGKKIMRIWVVDKRGQRISFGKANGRYWGKIISLLIVFAGFWMMVFTKKKQTLHDLFSQTLVLEKSATLLDKKPERALNDT